MINNIRASIEEMEQPKLLSKKSRGVFFRLDSVQFGAIQAGTLSRLKLELCNSTDKEVCYSHLVFLIVVNRPL